MSRRSLLVASLPHGPHDPVTETPRRRAGSVRRTTTIDQRRGDPGQPMKVLASGRDLLTRRAGDGGTEVLDTVAVRADLDARGHITAIEVDPPAPDLTLADDPLAWHDEEPMAPRSVRRRRRIDLIAGEPFELDVHFRDSHLGTDELEDVLHEYTLAGTVDPANLVVLSAEAVARTLPWPECPRALASATRVVGQPVSDLRALVQTTFTGTSTCTHLNDVLRSLAGVSALAPPLR